MLKFLCLVVFLVGALANQIDVEDRLIGGRVAKAREFTYQAFVRIPFKATESYRYCSAAILTEHFLVSTASCIHNRTGYSRYEAVVGTHHLKKGGDKHQLAKVHLHPAYNVHSDSTLNDISVLQTVNSIKFSTYVRPIALPTSDATTSKTFPVQLSGWGKFNVSTIQSIFRWHKIEIDMNLQLQKEEHSYPDNLLWGYAATLNRTECARLLGKEASKFNADTLCSLNALDSGACKGDRGSLLTTYGPRPVLVGIHTDSRDCVAHAVDLNVNIFTHLKFIRKIIN